MGKPPAKSEAKVTAKPRAARSKAVSAAPVEPDRIAALEAQVAALTQRLALLEGRVGGGVRPERGRTAAESKDGSGTRATDEAIRAAVLAAVGELDVRHRYGGIVPIPDVRAELRRGGINDDAAVTAALEALERTWKIDLSVAQSPTQVSDRAAGIERPGRGLLYYVARR
jgi:hypothetical protein